MIKTKRFGTELKPSVFPNGEFNIDLEITQQVVPSKFSFQENFSKSLIIGNFKNPLVSREQLNWKLGATW